MPASAKKSKSRQAFESVFEEQTRRFSAFDLLGLSIEAPPPTSSHPATLPVSEWVQSPTYSPGRSSVESLRRELRPNHRVQALRSDSHTKEIGPDSLAEEQVPDSPVQDQTLDPKQGQTVDGQALGQTVRPSLGQTKAKKSTVSLQPDRPSVVDSVMTEAVLLAPLQWKVWGALQNIEESGQITSYRKIAEQTNSTIDGVRKAVRVIQQEGGIIAKETVRTVYEQGFRVILNRTVAFRRGSLNEAKAILKRGLALGQTPHRTVQALRPDSLRMYVCKNINIKQTDIVQLLCVPPGEWNIREQTLVQIAEFLPDMTPIEFRLSLMYLVEQAKNTKEPIRNPNAWIKAAFEKNGAPLVTEREIEAKFERRLDSNTARIRTQGEEGSKEEGTNDVEMLKRYVMADVEVRAEIDRIAAERAAPLLKVVEEDKRAGILEEAKLEVMREFFSREL